MRSQPWKRRFGKRRVQSFCERTLPKAEVVKKARVELQTALNKENRVKVRDGAPVQFSYFLIHRMLERHGIFPRAFPKRLLCTSAFRRFVRPSQETQRR